MYRINVMLCTYICMFISYGLGLALALAPALGTYNPVMYISLYKCRYWPISKHWYGGAPAEADHGRGIGPEMVSMFDVSFVACGGQGNHVST